MSTKTPLDRQEELFTLLKASPTGVTVDDMAVSLGAPYNLVRRAISDLRRYLGATDQITLVADPGLHRQQWIYRLVGTMDEARPWRVNRLNDTLHRVRTMAAVTEPLVRGLGKGTLEGRKARIVHLHLTRLIEDIDLLVADERRP